MPRFSAGVLTAAGSTTLPIISLYNGAAAAGAIVEIGLTNTSAVAVALVLKRLESTGTQGAGLTESRHNPKKGAPACTAFTTHTVLPTLGDDLGYRTVLGAAVGSGVIWTFGKDGLILGQPDAVELVTDGIGVLVENGAGQVIQAYIVWDE